MLRWSAHLTFLFNELPFLERLRAAADAGFNTVEFIWENDIDRAALVRAKQESGVNIALFGIDLGDLSRGDRGFLNDPARRDWWRDRALAAIHLAERLDVRRINVLSGNIVPHLTSQQMLDCIYENLEWVIPHARASGATLVLEPLSRFDNPNYFFEHTRDAVRVIEKFNTPELQLQLDLYHVQRSEGNVVRVLQSCAPYIAHLQIADSPDRHQPGTGELNWRYIFQHIEQLNYNGYIGIEYHPIPDTLTSLEWLPRKARQTSTALDLIL